MKRILRPLSLVFILSVGCLSIAGATEYDEPRQVCVLSDERIDESSGLEVSASGRAVFYTHNDDEGDDRLFVFDATGATVGVHRLRIPTVKDWEDLSTFLLDEQAYILCADVGNNSRKRGEQLLYIVKEPPSVTGECELASAGRIQFSYDEGNRDCEAVAVDVPSGRILLATKEREPETSGLYEFAAGLLISPHLENRQKAGPPRHCGSHIHGHLPGWSARRNPRIRGRVGIAPRARPILGERPQVKAQEGRQIAAWTVGSRVLWSR